MAEYGENFRGGRDKVFCPFLCPDSLDSQVHSFHCETIRKHTTVEGTYEDIFDDNIPTRTCSTVTNIISVRRRLLTERFLTFTAEVSCPPQRVGPGASVTGS